MLVTVVFLTLFVSLFLFQNKKKEEPEKMKRSFFNTNNTRTQYLDILNPHPFCRVFTISLLHTLVSDQWKTVEGKEKTKQNTSQTVSVFFCFFLS